MKARRKLAKGATLRAKVARLETVCHGLMQAQVKQQQLLDEVIRVLEENDAANDAAAATAALGAAAVRELAQ